jgi:hypothetical protein
MSKKNPRTHPLLFGVLDTIHGRRGIHDRMSSLTVPLDAHRPRPRTALDDFAGFGVHNDTQGDAAFGFLRPLQPARLRGRRFGVERHLVACMSCCGGFFDARAGGLGEDEYARAREGGRSRSNENTKRTLRSLRSSSRTALSSSSTSSCAASSSVLAKSASNTSSSSNPAATHQSRVSQSRRKQKGTERTLVDDEINVFLGFLWFLECELGQSQLHPGGGQRTAHDDVRISSNTHRFPAVLRFGLRETRFSSSAMSDRRGIPFQLRSLGSEGNYPKKAGKAF